MRDGNKSKIVGIKPLKEFARKLRLYLHGIIASASYPLKTWILEEINNKIKLIKRMGYGYRDIDYFVCLQYSLTSVREA